MNKVELIGNLTKEPDVRFTKSGKAVASFTVACNNGRNRQTGEEYAPDYVPCEAWEKTAERMEGMGKGAYVLVMGKIKTRSWDGQDGKKQYKTFMAVDMVYPIAKASGGTDNGFNQMGQPVQEEIPF